MSNEHYSDWVSDNEDRLLQDFIVDGGKSVDGIFISTLCEHYERLNPKPVTFVGLVDAMINADRYLEEKYLRYCQAQYEQESDRSMAMYDKADAERDNTNA